MADELIISGIFDGSQIVEGIEKASSAIHDGTSEMISSFESLKASGQGISDKLSQMFGDLSESIGPADELRQAFQALGQSKTYIQELEIEAGKLRQELTLLGSEAGSALSPSLAQLEEAARGVAAGVTTLTEGLAPATAVTQEAAQAQVQFAAASEEATQAQAQSTAAFNEALAASNASKDATISNAQASADFAAKLLKQGMSAEDVASAMRNLGASAREVKAAIDAATGSSDNYTVSVAKSLAGNTQLKVVVDQVRAAIQQNGGSIIGLKDQLDQLDVAAKRAGGSISVLDNEIQVMGGKAGVARGQMAMLDTALAMGAVRIAAFGGNIGMMGFALASLVRSSEAAVAVFSKLFPLVAAALAVDMIFKAVEAIDAWRESARKGITDFDDLTVSVQHATDQVALTNLKLEDQIAKLRGEVEPNKLTEALLESKIQADQLTKSLEDAISKELDLLKSKEVGWFKSGFVELAPTTALREATEPSLQILHSLMSEQRRINAEGTADQKAAIAQRVEDARAGALKIAETTRKQIEEEKADFRDGLDTNKWTRKEAQDYADKQYSVALVQINDEISNLKNLKSALEDVTKAQKLRYEEAQIEKMNSAIKAFTSVYVEQAESQHSIDIERASEHERLAKQMRQAGTISIEEETNQLKSAAREREDAELRLLAAKRKAVLSIALTEEEQQKELEKIETAEILARSKYQAKISDIDFESSTRRRKQEIESILASEKEQLAITSKNSEERVAIIQSAINQILVAQGTLRAPKEGIGPPEILLPEKAKSELDKLNLDILKAQEAVSAAQNQIVLRTELGKVLETRAGTQARLDAEQIYLAKVADLYGEQTKEYANALNRMLVEERRFHDQQAKIQQDILKTDEQIDILRVEQRKGVYESTLPAIEKTSAANLRIEEAFAREEYEIHRSSLEEQKKLYDPEIIRKFEEQKAEIRRNYQGQDQELRLKDVEEQERIHADDPVKLQAIKNKELEIQQQYYNKVQQIQNQANKDRMALEDSINSTLRSSWARLIESMAGTYKDFQSALQGIWKGILSDFANFLATKFQKWFDEHVLEKIWEVIFGSEEKRIKQQTISEEESLRVAGAVHTPRGVEGATIGTLGTAPTLPGVVSSAVATPTGTELDPLYVALAESAGPLTGLTGGAATPATISELAAKASATTGISPDLIAAQWAHETAGFTSRLYKEQNNLAGITASGGGFRSYASPAASAEDYAKLLSSPRYQAAGVSGATTPETFAAALKQGGYFEDSVKNYTEGLKRWQETLKTSTTAISTPPFLPPGMNVRTPGFSSAPGAERELERATGTVAGVPFPREIPGGGAVPSLTSAVGTGATTLTTAGTMLQGAATQLMAAAGRLGVSPGAAPLGSAVPTPLGGIGATPGTTGVDITSILGQEKTKQDQITAIDQAALNLRSNALKLYSQQAMALDVKETINQQAQQTAQTAAATTGEAARTSTKAAGASSRGVIGMLEHAGVIVRAAARAAAVYYGDIVEWASGIGLPPPIPQILGAAGAAAVFVGIMAYGALGGNVGGKAHGGLIQGSGTSTSDSIPHMLSHGEYVVQAAAVDKLGLGTMEAINRGMIPSGRVVPGRAFGGLAMGGAQISSTTSGASTSNSFSFPTHIGNLSALDGASVRALLEEHGDLVGKIAIAKVKRHFRTNGVGGE